MKPLSIYHNQVWHPSSHGQPLETGVPRPSFVGIKERLPSEAEKELEKEQQHIAELDHKVGQLTHEVDSVKKSNDILNRKCT
jgi:uncharacterized protein YhaN